MPLTLTSPAFEPGAEIPTLFTCEGRDISPALHWAGVPTEARSLVLLVEDPDAPDPKAPKRIWIHWVLYDIPVSAQSLAQGVPAGELPQGTRQGVNDWSRTGYGGPCPPIGRHRYFHRLYALDSTLGERGALTKQALLAAMKGHVIAEAELMGTYQKTGR